MKYFPFKLFSRRDRKKAGYPGIFRSCGTCGKSFYVTSIEILFHSQHDSDGPMVCRLCRIPDSADKFHHSPATLERRRNPESSVLKM